MKRTLFSTVALLALAGPATAADTTEMAALTLDMVTRAAAHYADVGHDQSVIDFNEQSPEWYQEQYFLHMFGMSASGLVWADNVWPDFIGTDFSLTADFNDFEFGAYILENASDAPLLVELEFMNPDTLEITPSVGHCIKVDPDNILCSWTNG